jgi:amino acid permease
LWHSNKQTKEQGMNLKIKAAAIVVGIFAFTIVVQGVIAVAAQAYGAQAVLDTFIGGILVFLIYQMYTMILASLERDKKIDELSNKE